MEQIGNNQRELCRRYGATFCPPVAGARVGIALQSMHLRPVHGLRIAPQGQACGWYVWGGEWSDADDFFEPLCMEHLRERYPLVLDYLGLPPGWRFLTDGHSADLWFDANLVQA